MKPLNKICLLIVMFILMAGSCEEKAEAVLHKDMVEFDKSFVPVIYHVWNDDLEMAKRASIFLDYSWKEFNKKYQKYSTEENNIDEDLRMSQAWLGDAFTAIDNNCREAAYVYLDHVRFQLMDIRRKQKISYYMDFVWEFEAALDLVLEPSGDLMYCLLDQCEFNDLVSEMNYAWHQMNLAYFDADRFGFDDNKIFFYNFRRKKLKTAIKDFNKAFEFGDGEEIAVKASVLEVAYLDFLYCFGDFTSSKTHFATR